MNTSYVATIAVQEYIHCSTKDIVSRFLTNKKEDNYIRTNGNTGRVYIFKMFHRKAHDLGRSNIRLPVETFEHLNSLTLTSIVFDKSKFPRVQVNFDSLINHCHCLSASLSAF